MEKGTLDLIRKLSADEILKQFNLVGGTALALLLGHRLSIDIDLFTSDDFDSKTISDHLETTYGAEIKHAHTNGIFCYINNIKLDMVTHQFRWLSQPAIAEGVRLVTLDDIAAMKINAIIRSGERLKDFVDVFFLLENRTLNQVLKAYEAKYPDANPAIAKMALLYHREIDFGTKVNLLDRDLKWIEIVERLKQSVVQPEKLFSSQHQPLKHIKDAPDRKSAQNRISKR